MGSFWGIRGQECRYGELKFGPQLVLIAMQLECKGFGKIWFFMETKQLQSLHFLSSLTPLLKMAKIETKKCFWRQNVAIGLSKYVKPNARSISSNINEVSRSVLNFFCFYDKILQVQKSTKRIQGTKKYKKTTNLRFIDLRFINLRFIDLRFINLRFIDLRFIKLKKHLSGKK